MKITSSQFWAVLFLFFIFFFFFFHFLPSRLVKIQQNRFSSVPNFVFTFCLLPFLRIFQLLGWLVGDWRWVAAGRPMDDDDNGGLLLSQKSGSGIVYHYMGSETVVFLILFNFFKIH